MEAASQVAFTSIVCKRTPSHTLENSPCSSKTRVGALPIGGVGVGTRVGVAVGVVPGMVAVVEN